MVHIRRIVNSSNITLPGVTGRIGQIILQMNSCRNGCRISTCCRNITCNWRYISRTVLGSTKEITVQSIVIQISSGNNLHFFELATIISSGKGQNCIITRIDNVVFSTTFKGCRLGFDTIDSQLGSHFRSCAICDCNRVTSIWINRVITIHDASFSRYTTSL